MLVIMCHGISHKCCILLAGHSTASSVAATLSRALVWLQQQAAICVVQCLLRQSDSMQTNTSE